MSTKFRGISRVVILLSLVVALALPLILGLPEPAEGAEAYGIYTMWFEYDGWQWVQVGEEGTYCNGTRYSWGRKTPDYMKGNHCTEW